MPVPVHTLASTEDVPDGTRRAPAGVGARRAVRLQQRRVRRARADRGAGEREPIPSPRAGRGVRAGGYGRHRLPALRRAPGATPPSATFRCDGARTNVFHLPVLGSGDGGIYSTAADFARLLGGALRGPDRADDAVAEMVRPRSDWPEENAALRARVCTCTRRRCRMARGVRRRGVVHQPARSRLGHHLDRHVELVGRRLAPRPAAERPGAARPAGYLSTDPVRARGHGRPPGRPPRGDELLPPPELSGVASTRSTPARPTTEGIDRHTPESPCTPSSREVTGSTRCSSFSTASRIRETARPMARLVAPLPAMIS